MNLPLHDVITLIPADHIVEQFPLIPNTHADTLDHLQVESVSIDSRTLEPGALFFAFAGELVDGRAFIDIAFRKGAVLCIGTKPLADLRIDSSFAKGMYIQVQDTLTTLQAIARAYREQYIQATNIIGVTGSVGKTTVKDMLCGALRSLHPYATIGNLNNHIGVPLSVLSISVLTPIAILEAGMNHRGEIRPLAEIVQPDVVVITQIGVAHIEYLKTREEIAAEKLDLAVYSPRAHTILIPSTDEYASYIQSLVETANTHRPAGHANITCIPTSNTNNIKIDINLPGEHMRANAFLAYTTALLFKINPEDALHGIAQATITPRRLQVHTLPHHITVIDDTYNANPDSMHAGLAVCNTYADVAEGSVNALYKKRIAILGGMAELGEQSEAMHKEITESLKELSAITEVYFVGDLAVQYGIKEYHVDNTEGTDHKQLIHRYFKTTDACLSYINDNITKQKTDQKDQFENILFFVKGSKSTKMSDLADLLLENIKHSIK